ncbi:teichoic acid biosynthesis protein, partial [bacterium]|nr:teichoic acid biosynthesis protein [bacterium]
MARILYGVAGEGMGHAMRSRVIIDHLTERHDVQVVVSGRAHDYLKARERDRLGVKKIWGFSIVYEDNAVLSLRTALYNLTGAAFGGWPRNVRAYFELVEEFRPDVVVSDFESWSHLFAKTHGLPVFSVDNNQIVNRCHHPVEIL